MISRIPHPAPIPGERPGPASPVEPSSVEQAMLDSLWRLDGAIEAYEKSMSRPIVLRIGRGVATHFRARATEWFATALLLQFGFILYFPPDVFETSPNLAVMASWANEQTWGAICLVIGAVHLAALTVNGTFPSFQYSPHIRAGASFLACFLWFQITLAIFMSGVGGTGLGTYRLVLLLEIYNFTRACSDASLIKGGRGRDAR